MKRLIAAATVGLILLPTYARAWHNRGHMAVARVAWERLRKDGLTDEVTKILEGHPHRDTFLLQDKPAGIDKDEWMFVQAATWPDWVRKPHGPGIDHDAATAITKKYHHSPWHFVNLPYVHPKDSGKFDEAKIKEQALAPELDSHGGPRHALAAIKINLQQIQAAHASAEERAIALCWVLHLIGDLHQPLHAVALIASKDTFGPQEMPPPHGDEGANRLAIRIHSSNHNAIELHSYWDALLVEDRPYPEVRTTVLSWLDKTEFGRGAFDSELKKKETLAWAEESLSLAKTVVYMDDKKFLDVHALPPTHSSDDLKGLSAPVLSAGYQAKAEQTAKQRIVLGGYRLGDVLTTTVKPSK